MSAQDLRQSTPSIDDVKALDGRIFAMLSAEDLHVLKFFRDQGRKYGVSVTFLDDPTGAADLAPLQADAMRKRTNCRVTVTVAPLADRALGRTEQ